MAITSTLLSTETRDLTLGIGGWVSVSNASLRRQVEFSPYTTTLGGDQEKNSLRVAAIVGGNVEASTEKFGVHPGEIYKGNLWIAAESAYTAEVSFRWYDAGTTLLSTSTSSYTLLPGQWALVSITDEAPELAAQADIFVKIFSMAANERVFFANTAAFNYRNIYSWFLKRVYDHIPDYIHEADKKVEGRVDRPLARWLAAATVILGQASDDVVGFDYVRSSLGEESLSTLTDPNTANAEWLGWLAQQVGVTLSVGDGNLPSWEAFAAGNILDWDQWEQDVVSGGSGPDTTWVGIENYDFSAVDSALASFREQIASGYNGVLSSSTASMAAFLGNALASNDPEPWVFVRKHFKTHPFKQAIVYKETEEPGPGLVANAASLAAPAATQVTSFAGIKYAAQLLYDARDYASTWSHVLSSTGYTPLPYRSGAYASFIDDATLSGVNLPLYGLYVAAWSNPARGGGVGRARFYDGHALYAGAVEATTASDSALNILGDIDIRVLVSDLALFPAHDTGPTRNLISSENKWNLSVTDAGYVQFAWTEAGPTNLSETSSAKLNFARPHPQWLRVTLDVDNGSGGRTVTFYTANNLFDGWAELGTPQTSAGTTDIITNATNFVTLLSKDVSDVGQQTSWTICTLYRALVLDGIDGTTELDINFLDQTNSSIKPGTLSFTEAGDNSLAVTVSGATDAETYFADRRWRFIDHAGVDLFHFGMSPNKEDGDTVSLGDTLAVNMGSADNYYWTITYFDDTTTQVNESTTTITWDADDYGGTLIKDITVRTGSHGGTVVAQFLPAIVAGSTTSGPDAYSKTWTLTRSFEAGSSFYYEPSAVVDRPYFLPVEAQNNIYAPLAPWGGGTDATVRGAFTHLMLVRRQWKSGITGWVETGILLSTELIFGSVQSDGFRYEYLNDTIKFSYSDGVGAYWFEWDEFAAGRTGEWNLIGIRACPAKNKVEALVNGTPTLLGEYFPDQYLLANGELGAYASAPDSGPLDKTGTFGIAARIKLDDWTTNNGIKWIASKGTGTGDLAYQIGVRGTGSNSTIYFGWYDSSNVYNEETSNVTGIIEGAAWIGAKFSPTGGAGSVYRVSFYASPGLLNLFLINSIDGATGSDVRATTSELQIPGVWNGSTEGEVEAQIYRVMVDNGNLEIRPGTTQAFDADFQDTNNWDPQSASGTEGSLNAATVTLNGTIGIRRTPNGSREVPASSSFYRIGAEQAVQREVFNIAQIALFDHYVDDDLLAEYMIEESIS